MSKSSGQLDLSVLRQRLAARQGREYWRSLDEVADTEAFRRYVEAEFPTEAPVLKDEVGRRGFLKLMGASLALAGWTGCTRQPTEKIYPYVRPPEYVVPGRPLFFATAMPLNGVAHPVLVESHMGRPTKIEGNPEHPASLGATDAFAQASVLGLYDPDRSQALRHAGQISTWSALVESMALELEAQRARDGAGLRVLTGTVTSPTLGSQLKALLREFPEAKWHQYEPVSRDNVRAGAGLAFRSNVETRYAFDQADVILSLDADLLCSMPGSVRYARDFARGRRVTGQEAEARRREGRPAMNRLYVVEPTPSNTGSMADHRLALRPGDIQAFAAVVAKGLGVAVPAQEMEPLDAQARSWAETVARDLARHRGRAVVVAGDAQPPFVHAMAHSMNGALDAVGATVSYAEPIDVEPTDQMASLRELADDIEAGRVEMLVVLDSNPVYSAPADLRFGERLLSVPWRCHLGLYHDETARLCQWHVPTTHYLESWGDARAYDGTVTIMQPLIAPLYGGRSAYELVDVMAGNRGRSTYDIVRAYWKEQGLGEDFETGWQVAVHDGFIKGSAPEPRALTPSIDWNARFIVGPEDVQRRDEDAPAGETQPADPGASAAATTDDSSSSGGGEFDIVFRPDATVWDGRFANNGWLQELPKALTKLTWDNAALVSPATAERLSLSNEQIVELRHGGRSVSAPVWILPGQANDCVTVHFGYGRTRAGKIGTGIGFNAYALRSGRHPEFARGLVIRPTSDRHPLATTQHHHAMEGRNLVRAGTLAEFKANPAFVSEMGHEPARSLSLYPGHPQEGYQWGMAIDLNGCTGCNACVVACQSENNIPIVGKKEVAIGRVMHWLRIDRYFEGDLDGPDVYHQPLPCMHCENAPCEVVCPVNATVHSAEGLNEMVYNRCVGTRYCANNCPYKVRRFNFYEYADFDTPSLALRNNPDVTVRTRGIMEKCSYCVQRISAARIEAKKENRSIRDGEVATACEAACPSEAIVFGDINDPNSRVSRLRNHPLNYGLLEELNTRPRTTYLGRLRNPNPELSES